jgi:hypothetical protein
VRSRVVPVAVLIAGGVSICALRDPGRTANSTLGTDSAHKVSEEKADQAIRSVRSIRIDSDSPPWVIMHALLAFGPDFEIADVRRHEPVRILDWICGPGSVGFFQVVPGSSYRNSGTRDGVQSRSECHPDQWLCILSAHSVPLSQRISLDGKRFTLSDLLEASRQQSASGCSETAAWTIPAFCRYVPSKARWQNELGEEVTVAGLAMDFLQREDWKTGPCNGTHHLDALAALKAAGILKSEAAARLDQVLSEALQLLQRNQNADGTWMYNWQTEKDKPQNVFDAVHIAGHHLEWVAVAAAEEQLNEEWLQNAVRGLVTAIDGMDMAEVEEAMKLRPEVYGSLCHAVRGLRLINRRWRSAGQHSKRR